MTERLKPVLRVAVSAEIDAYSADIYRLIADYHDGHPRILPREFFRNLRVEVGGYGAGSVITVELLSFGRVVHLRGRVSEPEPGRFLAETYEDETVTTFVVDSLERARSRVTISSQVRTRSGAIGYLQRLLTGRFLRRVYEAELKLIDEQVRRQPVNVFHTTVIGLPRRKFN